MSHRPYPRRDRALHQAVRGRARRAPMSTVAFLESDGFRTRVRLLGVPAATGMSNAQAALARMPSLLRVRNSA